MKHSINIWGGREKRREGRRKGRREGGKGGNKSKMWANFKRTLKASSVLILKLKP